eukprot:NODE_7_length_67686_cov_1.621421.p57 type:complete len:115 gc:universal NODE_7_length_67686_cov_1.621421:25014-25358(+)
MFSLLLAILAQTNSSMKIPTSSKDQLSEILKAHPEFASLTGSDLQQIADDPALSAQIAQDANNGNISNSTLSAVSDKVSGEDSDPQTTSNPKNSSNSGGFIFASSIYVIWSFAI